MGLSLKPSSDWSQRRAETRPCRCPAASREMGREMEGKRRDCGDSPARGTGGGGRRCGLTGDRNGGGGAAGADSPVTGTEGEGAAGAPLGGRRRLSGDREKDRMGRVGELRAGEEGSGPDLAGDDAGATQRVEILPRTDGGRRRRMNPKETKKSSFFKSKYSSIVLQSYVPTILLTTLFLYL